MPKGISKNKTKRRGRPPGSAKDAPMVATGTPMKMRGRKPKDYADMGMSCAQAQTSPVDPISSLQATMWEVLKCVYEGTVGACELRHELCKVGSMLKAMEAPVDPTGDTNGIDDSDFATTSRNTLTNQTLLG